MGKLDKTCNEIEGNYGDNPLLALYDEVIQECGITEEVGDRIGIQQVGNTQMFKCVCPFHEDHKPSMWLNKQSQRFECYSCGASGDVVDFVTKIDGLPEKDALVYLATKAGIDPEDFLGQDKEKA